MIKSLLPAQRRGGRWQDYRTVLDDVFCALNFGAQWRAMPERYGRWQSVYGCNRRRVSEGLFDAVLRRLQIEFNEHGRIDPLTAKGQQSKEDISNERRGGHLKRASTSNVGAQSY